jgi:hypothetical protein
MSKIAQGLRNRILTATNPPAVEVRICARGRRNHHGAISHPTEWG